MTGIASVIPVAQYDVALMAQLCNHAVSTNGYCTVQRHSRMGYVFCSSHSWHTLQLEISNLLSFLA